MTFRYAPHQIVALAREVPLSELRNDPQPGDLVIEPSIIGRDADAIGWLVGHDDAPYNEDGTGEMREVWHVIPLSGPVQDSRWGDGSLRWENAEFFGLPESIAALAR